MGNRIIEINVLVGIIFMLDGIFLVINWVFCVVLLCLLGMFLVKDNILVNSLNMGWIDIG